MESITPTTCTDSTIPLGWTRTARGVHFFRPLSPIPVRVWPIFSSDC